MTEEVKRGFPCKISLCDPPVQTEIEPIESAPIKFVIELGGNNAIFMLSIGMKISVGDIIGYIGKKPVKSQINGIISEVNDKYVIGEYSTDENEFTEEKIKQMFNL